MKPDDIQAREEARARAFELVNMLHDKCGPMDHLPAHARPDSLFSGFARVIYEMGQHSN
jgi:hypothetical protein